MASFMAFPPLIFADSYAQPSDGYNGRRLTVSFDSTNIYLNGNGYFSDSGMISIIPVIVTVDGTTFEGPTSEDFLIYQPGESTDGSLHFTTFANVSIVGNKIFTGDAYGAVEVKEKLPLSLLDDGYNSNEFLKTIAYGNGIFVITDTNNEPYDPGYGQYEFEYASPFQINLNVAPDKIYIGNSMDLTHAADGIIDEVKITSAIATKSRSRNLVGSYDISVEASSPIFSEPDAKTLVLLHLNDNTQFIIDAIRDPLDSANLSDSILATIVSLRNSRTNFINYVDSLNITGTLVEESLDIRPFSEQLFDLITVLNNVINSAQYYKLSGKFFPSEITVNSNFEFAAVFSGDEYVIEKPGLINNNSGSIELWIAPLSNLLGDLNRRVYLDSINHAVIGKKTDLQSITPNLIQLPNNIIAQHINAIYLAGEAGRVNTFNFGESASISNDGTTIILTHPLPGNNVLVIVDYIPFSSTNDRITLYKDEDSNLVFSLSANSILYHSSHDISNWKKNEWHRVMITWKANDKNNLDHLNMYVDGTQTTIIKYGEGFLFNTFVFKQEHQANISTKIFPQNIQFLGSLDKLYVGTDFMGFEAGMCRLANLKISFIERQPLIDARGFKIDSSFDGGSKSATPQLQDQFTSYLENFDPQAGFVTNFATAQNNAAGAHDLRIIIRDDFKLVRGVNNGQVERLLRELIKIIKPAEARTRITITTNSQPY